MLSICIAFATFGVLAPLVHWAIPATDLPPPFTEQHQDAETLLFVIAFAVALPLSLLAGPRLADRIAAGQNAGSIGGAATLALVFLFGAVVFVKFSEHLPWGSGLGTLLAASLAWFVAAAVLAGRLISARPIPASMTRLFGHGRELRLLAGLLAFAVALSFARLGSIAVIPLIVGLIAAAGAAHGDRIELRRRPAEQGSPGTRLPSCSSCWPSRTS